MSGAAAALVDLHPEPARIARDAVEGLSAAPKRLPCKYFYDARGSALFEWITRQPEYYLTRIEQALLQRRLPQLSDLVGTRAHVVEYGSGSGHKTQTLLAALGDPVAYTPIEISREALLASVARLGTRLPRVQMLPVCADFTAAVALPAPRRRPRRTLVFFPGSTLGNFVDQEAVALLRVMRATLGANGLALVGIDLDKAPAIVEAAYNDAAGVTAAFTLNLLARLNREIGSDFALDRFRHRARYSRTRRRIETSLVSLQAQRVHVCGRAFDFAADEPIQVEYSHKYTDPLFAALAARAGLQVAAAWNDESDWYGLRLLRPVPQEGAV